MLSCFLTLPSYLYGQSLNSNESRDERNVFTIEPSIISLIGDTSYVLETTSVKSKLEFPLNTILAGVNIKYEPSKKNIISGFRLSSYTNIVDPYGTMNDHDWHKYSSYPDIKFSYTESKPTMQFFQIEGAAFRNVLKMDNYSLDLFLKYCYQYIHQKIDNYEGWQYQWNDSIGTDGAYELYLVSSSGDPVLDYIIQYHRPKVGIKSYWSVDRYNISIDLHSEVFYVSDYDDHILRNKESTASGIGYGGGGNLKLKYYFNIKRNKPNYYISFLSGIEYLYAPIEQTQHWYGDDPATSDDDTGKTISGIDYTIRSKQISLSINFGIEL